MAIANSSTRMKNQCLIAVLGLFMLGACATIPKEVPELSFQLGQQIDRIEAAHLNLLDAYFEDKKEKVDQFMTNIWLPKFATNFLNQPAIQAAWEKAKSTGEQVDILNLILLLGPELQKTINEKRLELINPLDQLQTEIKNQIKSDYNLAKSMNLTLTSYLQSAQTVAANRQDFLSALGISQDKIDSVIDKTDQALSKVDAIGQKVEDAENTFNQAKEALNGVLSSIK